MWGPGPLRLRLLPLQQEGPAQQQVSELCLSCSAGEAQQEGVNPLVLVFQVSFSVQVPLQVQIPWPTLSVSLPQP